MHEARIRLHCLNVCISVYVGVLTRKYEMGCGQNSQCVSWQP